MSIFGKDRGGTVHTVKQGEYFANIAKKYGFSNWSTIYEHGDNIDLRQQRTNPNILYPGDKIAIPEKTAKEESGETEKRHRFRYKGESLWLRIVMRDTNSELLTNTAYRLNIDGETVEDSTNEEGLIEKRIPPDAEKGLLIIKGREIILKIGHLDPVDEVTGWKARLNNLGYNAGRVDEEVDKQAKSAIQEFQCDHQIKVDGIVGPKTQAKLEEIHGC